MRVRSVIVIGSTRSELEEQLVVEAIKRLKAQIVWAPRHVERTDAIATLLKREGIEAKRRSIEGQFSSHEDAVTNVLLIDTYGELSSIYTVADVVVIGGGFDNLGGQNLIQPLAHGKPVLHGPHMQNFKDVTAASLKAGASEEVATAEALRAALDKLLSNADQRARRGKAAKELVEANVGASRRYAEAIVEAAKL